MSVTVEGLTDLVKAFDELADRIPVHLRARLKEKVGDPVASRARQMFVSADLASPPSSRLSTVDGIQAQVGKTGEVFVVQTKRKSRNEAARRHNYGKLQLVHGFFPAAEQEENNTVRAVGEIVGEAINQHF